MGQRAFLSPQTAAHMRAFSGTVCLWIWGTVLLQTYAQGQWHQDNQHLWTGPSYPGWSRCMGTHPQSHSSDNSRLDWIQFQARSIQNAEICRIPKSHFSHHLWLIISFLSRLFIITVQQKLSMNDAKPLVGQINYKRKKMAVCNFGATRVTKNCSKPWSIL